MTWPGQARRRQLRAHRAAAGSWLPPWEDLWVGRFLLWAEAVGTFRG